MVMTRARAQLISAAEVHALGHSDPSLTHHFDFSRPETMTEVTTVAQPVIISLFTLFGIFNISFTSAHSLAVNDVVVIEGSGVAGWNKTFTVTAVLSSTVVSISGGAATENPSTATVKKITSPNLGKRWLNLGSESTDFAEAANALTNGPTYPGSVQFNGRNTVEILKNGDLIRLNIANNISPPYTVMTVHQRNPGGVATGRRVYSNFGGGGGVSAGFFGFQLWNFGANILDGAFSTSITVHAAVITSGDDDFYIDGSLSVSGTAGNNIMNFMAIGAAANQTQPLDGSLVELVIFSEEKSITEIAAITNVWGQKYDISAAR